MKTNAEQYYISSLNEYSSENVLLSVSLMRHAAMLCPEKYSTHLNSLCIFTMFTDRTIKPNIDYIKYRLRLKDCMDELQGIERTVYNKVSIMRNTGRFSKDVTKQYCFLMHNPLDIINEEYVQLSNIKIKCNINYTE
ncbi:hypothetical protein [Heterosigma akashiwo virus 01]|uniref:Uncharacterized protein n=1 Tax=Heterosigma akashiwo virus 01 TaxID=97195 RepID=A0A1C9C537_HAV01|nr:hypothetical protein D1R72_gp063 [Heterosigma akashiwo virus 01]AOM63394.1 hypothetical protein [Heterosigma akashiwo virus 01]